MLPTRGRHFIRLIRAQFVFFVAVWVLVIILGFIKGFGGAWPVLFAGLGPVLGLLLVGERLVRMSLFVRVVLERRCMKCDYMLGPLPDGHRCPECGTTIDTRYPRRYLARMLRLRDFEEHEQG